MPKKKVLMVLAHPDDEIILGWPVLQDPVFDKEILICSNDRHNPARKKYAHRREALAALCDFLQLPHTSLDYNSDFYRTPNRWKKKKGLRSLLPGGPRPEFLLGDITGAILEEISRRRFDYIFTHNFWGEYGHLDHILLNSLIFNNCSAPILLTDIRLPLDWVPLGASHGYAGIFETHPCSHHRLDPDFYERCAAFYKTTKTWTWSQPPVTEANLYLFHKPSPLPNEEERPSNCRATVMFNLNDTYF